MTEERSHKTTANRIAKKYRAEYNSGPGVDIKANRVTVEVETEKTLPDSLQQLKGSKGPVYLAGANKSTVEKALELTRGTTVGVMDNQGNIIKESTRK